MSDARHWLTSTIGLCAVLGGASACPFIDDPNHCQNMATSPCLDTQVCDPCTPSSQANGCVAPGAAVDEQLATPGCQLAGGATSTDPTESGPSTMTSTDPTVTTTVELDTTVTDGDTQTTTTGEPVECDAANGTYGDPCPVSAPFCVDGHCVPCTTDGGPSTSCAQAVDDGAPGAVCSGGSCVECSSDDASACGGTTPLCEDNACVACTAHDQCPGGAGCHLFEGSCLPSDAVYEVDETAVGCGQPDQPYCTVDDALDAAGVGNDATIRVMAGFYAESVIITSNAVVAIVADDGAMVTISGTGGSPGISVNVGGTGYLARIVVENGSVASGVQSAGDLRMDDATIRDANDGLVSSGGRVHLEDVRVTGNDVTGVVLNGGDMATFRNVIIANNGTGSTPRGLVASATPFTMVYTTIADNAGLDAGAINCTMANAQRAVRNSILASRPFVNAIDCEGIVITNSVVADSDYDVPTNTYITVANGDALMLDGNFEISPGSIAEDVAVWLDGDPPFDINGEMRPAVDGSPDAAGANVP